MRFRKLPLLALALILGVPAGGVAGGIELSAAEAIGAMQRAARGDLTAHVAPETRTYDFIDATGSELIARDDPTLAPTVRARAFLRRYGAALGMTDRERRSIDDTVRFKEVYADPAGYSHVRFTQIHDGHDVFGGALVVHMNHRGITGVNGTFVPNIAVPRTPSSRKPSLAR